MRQRGELRCLIAAGGTAGHVLPALAVAEALRRRGVTVTFAGSPERAEARLVPEAGYELDTFSVSGLPRRPGLALVRALAAAGRAPRAHDARAGAGGAAGDGERPDEREAGPAREPRDPEGVELEARLRDEPRLGALRRPGERHLHPATPELLRDRERGQHVAGRPPGRDQAPRLPLDRHSLRC